jgi:hypothetical protein
VIWDVMFLGFQSTGNFFMSMLLKLHGLEAFPITISFSNSPVIKPQSKTVILSLQCFPHAHTQMRMRAHTRVPFHHNLWQSVCGSWCIN